MTRIEFFRCRAVYLQISKSRFYINQGLLRYPKQIQPQNIQFFDNNHRICIFSNMLLVCEGKRTCSFSLKLSKDTFLLSVALPERLKSPMELGDIAS